MYIYLYARKSIIFGLGTRARQLFHAPDVRPIHIAAQTGKHKRITRNERKKMLKNTHIQPSTTLLKGKQTCPIAKASQFAYLLSLTSRDPRAYHAATHHSSNIALRYR